ncbi:hypothetical protein [Methylopila sp. 73B]|uniref:helix-turn-helix transcriptional regulator n=1 Tax=Methylopila sp. 73B TaxID=1120792 RepID=UPI00036FBE80|nr:hypothetical protein [Methylopila sp. 73B]
MTTHEFVIVATGVDPTSDDFETRFFEAGCDDATVSFQRGLILLDFARDADRFDEALASAIEAVRAAGAEVVRIEPDPLVSLADIAARTGMSRAAMTQYAKGQRGRNFPPPAAKVASESPLWQWASVSEWLFENHKLPADAVVEAVVLKRANELLDASAGALRADLKASAASHAATLEPPAPAPRRAAG